MTPTKVLPNTDPRREVGSIAVIDGERWLLVVATSTTWVFQPV